MRARRFDAVDRGGEDAEIGELVALQIALDHLARQHARHKDRAFRPLGHAVAQMAQPVDGQNHSAASLSSVPMKPPDWRFQ